MKENEQDENNLKSFFDDPMPIEEMHQSFGMIYVVKRYIRELKYKREVKKSQEKKKSSRKPKKK